MLSASRGAPAPLSISAQTTIKKHFPNLLPKQFMQHNYITTEEVGCLTDLCSGETLTEIEIFSLLEEQIPKYKLRSDCLTSFSGYSNHDWYTSTPALTIAAEGLGLTKDQTRETLNYFLFCGNRVSQMTRVFDDIEAVTRLLEEKEKDLELTVQIGKELLSQNNSLEIKISNLEADIRACNEDRTQILHELNKKIELVGILTNDDDWSDNEISSTSKSLKYDLLSKKVTFLQEENKVLKVEAYQLATKTDEVEELERKLMRDITTQLNEANMQNENLFLEIEQQREENRLLRDQITNITASLNEAEKRLHQLTNHNEEQKILLDITKDSQNSLALELAEFKQLYKEVFLLLQEAQEQLRNQRRKIMPNAKASYLSVLSVSHSESLHSELFGCSLYSQNSIDSGIAGFFNPQIEPFMDNEASQLQGSKYKKTFQTVRSATNKNSLNSDRELNNADKISRCQIRSEACLSSMMTKCTQANPLCSLISQCSYNDLYYNNAFSINGKVTHIDGSVSQMSGVPGAPGAKDLEDALKRLSPTDVLRNRKILSKEPRNSLEEVFYSYESPTEIRTPDSIMSTGSSGALSSPKINKSINQWCIPNKLKIVKPVEGSQTLNHWLKLATPTLNDLLEERPGVTIRGSRGLDDLGIQIYALSDLEEDIEENPGKQFEPSGCIFTYTTSIVMHPNDDFINNSPFMSGSLKSSNIVSPSTSRQTSCQPTPIASRRNSCSTFSVNLGLAAMLNERGIKAITPSALLAPISPKFSTVITSCNSSEGNSKHQGTTKVNSFNDHCTEINFRCDTKRSIKHQRTNQQISLSRLEKRALNSLKLVEKVESIGLHNIIAWPTKKINSFPLDISFLNHNELEPFQVGSNKIYEPQSLDYNQLEGIFNRGMYVNGSKYKSETTTQKCSKNIIYNKKKKLKRDPTLVHSKTSNCAQAESPIHKNTNNTKNISRHKVRTELKICSSTQRSDLGTIVSMIEKKMEENYSIKDQSELRTNLNDELKHSKDLTKEQSFAGSLSTLLFGRKGGWL